MSYEGDPLMDEINEVKKMLSEAICDRDGAGSDLQNVYQVDDVWIELTGQLDYENLANDVLRSDWLAKHDAVVAKKAWERGAESAFFDPEVRGQVDYPANPYSNPTATEETS